MSQPPIQFHIAVCDDSPQDLHTIQALSGQILEDEGISYQMECFSSGLELMDAIRGGSVFQLLMLDVIMDELGGMELAAALRSAGNNVALLFISSNHELALRGYEVSAVRYLAKPLEPARLREALLFCYQAEAGRRLALLPTSKGRRALSCDEFIYAEVSGRGTRLFLTSETLESSTRISDLEKLLPASLFARCHQGFLVNLSFVRYLRHNELELKSGATLPVSKYRIRFLREKLVTYLEG